MDKVDFNLILQIKFQLSLLRFRIFAIQILKGNSFVLSLSHIYIKALQLQTDLKLFRNVKTQQNLNTRDLSNHLVSGMQILQDVSQLQSTERKIICKFTKKKYCSVNAPHKHFGVIF